MKSTESILKKIEQIPPGVIFNYKDLCLPGESQMAGAKALSRMVAEKKLKKAGKGRFFKPAYSRLGEMTPRIEELVKHLLYKDNKLIGYITGIPAFSQLGLTTQISSKIIIGSNIYRRPLQLEGYEISFTLQKNQITEEKIPVLRFLDALRFIKKIPACSPDKAIEILINKLSSLSNSEIKLLKESSILYEASTRAMLGAMLEIQGLECLDLFSTLNPLSSYKIEISETILPNKLKWHIV